MKHLLLCWSFFWVSVSPSFVCAQSLKNDTVVANPGIINELRVDLKPQEGFSLAYEEWLLVSGEADGRSYENGRVFVYTGRSGTSKVLWSATYVSWEEKRFYRESRVFVLKFGDEPDDDVVVSPEPNEKTTVAVYVYEKDKETPPRPIQAAMTELANRGLNTALLDKDVRTGTGGIPSQYKDAITAAKDRSTPYLAFYRGNKWFFKNDPQTKEDVLEAIK